MAARSCTPATAFLKYRRVHLEEKNIETKPHSLDECGKEKDSFSYRSLALRTQLEQTAQSAQADVRMRNQGRHVGLMRTETPVGQTSLARCLIRRTIVPGNRFLISK